MPTVSCVICAYNEGPRIGSVLEAVSNHPLLSETVVVDDGSTDNTAEVVRQFPSARLVSLPKNRGKSYALSSGIEAVSGDLILYLDADLKNLQPRHITSLIEPVIQNKADLSISLRENSLLPYRAIGLDFVSGERVLSRTFVTPYLEAMRKLPPFGIESFLNEQIIQRGLRIAIVPLDCVINVRKSEKMGRLRGTLADYKTILDILHVISPLTALRQNYRMLSLARRAGTSKRANISAELSHE
jgi:glycosyltransferase involved in cell wall biosynthesis